MNEIILSFGSNIEGRRKVAEASSRLSFFVYDAHATPVIDTEPIGISSAQPFANAMMRGYTALPFHALQSVLKNIERMSGRNAADAAKGIIHLDIDIMQYGERRLKLSDWHRPYITTLLKHLLS